MWVTSVAPEMSTSSSPQLVDTALQARWLPRWGELRVLQWEPSWIARWARVIPGIWEKGEEGLPRKRRPWEAGHRTAGLEHRPLRLILSLGNGSPLTV